MAETEKRILATMAQAIRQMSDSEQDRLLLFSEGMACMAAMSAGAQPAPPPQPPEAAPSA